MKPWRIACSRLMPVLVVFAASTAHAQQADTDLLAAILCELKELRAAVHQGQVVAPLLDANVREREQTQKRLDELEDKHGHLDQAIQANVAKQASAREELRTLPRSDGSDPKDLGVSQRRKELEFELQLAADSLQRAQAEMSFLASGIARSRTRLSDLEDEFDRTQRQMRSAAAASSAVCEPPAQ